MPKPVLGSLFSALLLTVALSAATDTPDSAEQQRMLEKVRQFASRYLDNLPNFVCSRITEQYEAGKKPKDWRRHETLTTRLIFNQGKENETLELVNGKPIRPGHFIERPLETQGEFGGLVSLVLDERTSAQIVWTRWEDLRGQRMAVFEYVVDQDHSKLTIGVDGLDTIVPYRGLIYADPETGELWRITNTPFNIPAAVDTKSVNRTIDYGPVDINNKHFILPVSATILLDTGRRNILNKVSFNEYRKFDAESKITFVTGSN